MQNALERIDRSTGEVSVTPVFDIGSYLTAVTTPDSFALQQQLSAAYDAAVKALIGPNDVQEDKGREFKKKSAWRKLARHFQISTQVVAVDKEWAGDGDFVATVTVRAHAPWGQYAEAAGACAKSEERGARVITIADAVATAETRATNRATSNLIAMGEVSAEEMSKGDAPRAARASSGPVDSSPVPPCPVCGKGMWDNRKKKASGEYKPNAPDFTCKDKACGKKVWKDSKPKAGAVIDPSDPALEVGQDDQPPLPDEPPYGGR